MTIESGKYKAVITKPYKKKWRIVYFKKDTNFTGWSNVGSGVRRNYYGPELAMIEFALTKQGAIRKANREMKGWTDRDTHNDQRFEVFSK